MNTSEEPDFLASVILHNEKAAFSGQTEIIALNTSKMDFRVNKNNNLESQ